MIGPFQRLKDNLQLVQGGVLMVYMMGVGISSLLENAVVNVTNKVYNKKHGPEIDSTLLDIYPGN